MPWQLKWKKIIKPLQSSVKEKGALYILSKNSVKVKSVEINLSSCTCQVTKVNLKSQATFTLMGWSDRDLSFLEIGAKNRKKRYPPGHSSSSRPDCIQLTHCFPKASVFWANCDGGLGYCCIQSSGLQVNHAGLALMCACGSFQWIGVFKLKKDMSHW